MEDFDPASYAKGYNAGYLLQQYEPELSEHLNTSIQSRQYYIQGLNAGREQYLAEVKERLAKYQPKQPEPSPDKGRDIER